MKISRNMRFKMFAAALVINLIAILSISLFFYQRSSSFFDQEYAESLVERIYMGEKHADMAFQQVYCIALDTAYDREVGQAVREPQEENLEKLAGQLQHAKNKDALIDRVYCYVPSRHMLVTSEEYNAVQSMSPDKAARWIETMNEQHDVKPLFTTDTLNSSAKNVYVYYTTITDDAGQVLAHLAVTISERSLYYNYFGDFIRNGNNTILLFDDKGNSVSGNRNITADDKKILTTFLSGSQRVQQNLRIGGIAYAGIWDTLPFSHYTCCLLVDQQSFLQKETGLRILYIIITFIILFFSAGFLYFFSVKLNKPVEKLAETMKAVGDGDLSCRAEVYDHDEIGYLANSFNHMAGHMNTLINTLANEKALKKEAELNALQYQIRPHFIYNTLNAIRFAALMQGAKNIGDRLADFIAILRASTNRKGGFTTLKEEIDILKNYISLQEFRMLDTFEVTFAVAADTQDCIVPSLMLQPLVENSIIHGPSETRAFCHIQVRSYIRDEKLYLEVCDDGKGMDLKQIMSLNGPAVRPSHGGMSGIGVHNVRDRLRLYYGDMAMLTYYSDGATYTRACICLPVSFDVHAHEL